MSMILLITTLAFGRIDWLHGHISANRCEYAVTASTFIRAAGPSSYCNNAITGALRGTRNTERTYTAFGGDLSFGNVTNYRSFSNGFPVSVNIAHAFTELLVLTTTQTAVLPYGFSTYCSTGGGSPDEDDCIADPDGDEKDINVHDEPWCGTPLVVDLRKDGVNLTSGQPVVFDISGYGPRETNWIADPNDPLLAMDWDGDGAITSSDELFGTNFAGNPHGHGFAALSTLDDPANGGNADGIIDARDRLYHRILLWFDDGDGVSSKQELRRLSGFITELDPVPTFRNVYDQYGNGLRYWSTCKRADGVSVDVIDVYFSLAQ